MPSPAFETDSKGNFYILLVSVLVVCGGVMMGTFFWVKQEKPGVINSQKISESIRAEVHFDGPNIVLRNQNSFSWNNDMLVYIGDAPPVGYSHNAGIVSPGDTISLALNDFVRSTGEKFTPYAMVVRDVWIGGSDYQFQNFRDTGTSNFYGVPSVAR